jgi:hypothetical protein
MRQGMAGSLSRIWMVGEEEGELKSLGPRGFPLRGLGRRPRAKGLVGEGEQRKEGGGKREMEDMEELSQKGHS